MREIPQTISSDQDMLLVPQTGTGTWNQKKKSVMMSLKNATDVDFDNVQQTQMLSLEKHEEEYGTSTVYSGAQRGRLSLPQEQDARLLDFDDDISFVRAATDTLRNNATRVLF